MQGLVTKTGVCRITWLLKSHVDTFAHCYPALASCLKSLFTYELFHSDINAVSLSNHPDNLAQLLESTISKDLFRIQNYNAIHHGTLHLILGLFALGKSQSYP